MQTMTLKFRKDMTVIQIQEALIAKVEDALSNGVGRRVERSIDAARRAAYRVLFRRGYTHEEALRIVRDAVDVAVLNHNSED